MSQTEQPYQEIIALLKKERKFVYAEAEVATMFGVSVDKVQRWRRAGLIGYTQLPQPRAKAESLNVRSSDYCYSEDDIKNFMSRFHREPMQEPRGREVNETLGVVG